MFQHRYCSDVLLARRVFAELQTQTDSDPQGSIRQAHEVSRYITAEYTSHHLSGTIASQMTPKARVLTQKTFVYTNETFFYRHCHFLRHDTLGSTRKPSVLDPRWSTRILDIWVVEHITLSGTASLAGLEKADIHTSIF